MNCPACNEPGYDAVPSDGFQDTGDGTMIELVTCPHCRSTRSRGDFVPVDYRLHLVNRKAGVVEALLYLKRCRQEAA